MSDIRVFIESTTIVNTQVYPAWKPAIDFVKQEDAAYFLAEFPTLAFRQADYTLLQTAVGCEEITVIVQERCNGTWAEIHRGTFTDYDEKKNENQCWAEVKPKMEDDYRCLFAKWETEVVVYAAGVTTSVGALIGEYQLGPGLCCTVCSAVEPPGAVCAVPAGYCFNENIDLGEHPSCAVGERRWRSCFHRLVGVGTPVTPPTYGTGWTYISGNNWWRCPSAAELAGGNFGDGKLFNDILQNIVAQMACGLTVRSHFFDINSTHAAAPVNSEYTDAAAFYQKMTIHQKSDIKRPFADDPAESTQWKMTLKKLLDDLWTMFRVQWVIDGTDLIIEHETYFAAGMGLDVSAQDLVLEYGKTASSAPKRENFFWVDRAAFSTPFKGYPILYDCGDKIENRPVNLFSTDVNYITDVENEAEISDTNFVLIANEIVTGNYYMMDSNSPLGWVALHDSLHRNNRYFLEGTMNNVATTFNSVRKTRALEEFAVTVCCDDVFNPSNEITTSIGLVSPEKVTINYDTGNNARQLIINANI